MSFQKFKETRQDYFSKVSEKIKETSNPNAQTYSNKDDRIWYPDEDRTGAGSAIIRFLPNKDGSSVDLPWVKAYKHGFQGPTGSWLVEDCPTSIGKPCPVCEANRLLWNSGIESDKKIASQRKRKTNYYSNIYIIKDPLNPDNEGKVKIFRYGKFIFDKLNDLMNPSSEFDDLDPVNPFDLWAGATFRLRFKKDKQFRTYAPSTFDNPAPLFADDAELEKVYNQLYDLSEFVDPEKFSSYDKIATRLKRVTEGVPEKDLREIEDEEVEETLSSTSKSEETSPWDSDDDVEATDFDKFFEDLKD